MAALNVAPVPQMQSAASGGSRIAPSYGDTLGDWAWYPRPVFTMPRYSGANKIQAIEHIRSDPVLMGDNSAAEKVYDIPESRDMLFRAVNGRRTSAALAGCLQLDRRAFKSVVPFLYHYPAPDVAVKLAQAGVAYHRYLQYIPSVKCLSIQAEQQRPSMGLFVGHLDRFPQLRTLHGRWSGCLWTIQRIGEGDHSDASPHVFELSMRGSEATISGHKDAAIAMFGVSVAVQCGLRLVGLSFFSFAELAIPTGAVPGGDRAKPFLELVGGSANLLHLRQLKIQEVDRRLPYPGTTTVRSIVALCPKLEDLSIGLDPPGVHDDDYGQSLQFPIMYRLRRLHISHFNSRNVKLETSTERVLRPALFPSLEELTVGVTSAAFYGFVDDWATGGGRNWASERQHGNLLPVRKLVFQSVDGHVAAAQISALTIARSIAKKYHPRCILVCKVMDSNPMYLSLGDVPDGVAYWFRAVREIRDQLVEEEVLDMRVGWWKIPTEWQLVRNDVLMEDTADE